MTAKEYLRQLQRLDTVINQKIKELDDLRLMSQSVSAIDYAKDRVQSSPSGTPFEKPVLRMIELEQEINAEIDRFVEEKHKIIGQIQALSNRLHIELLFKRYVEFKGFETIGVEMGITYQYTIELHGIALKEFAKTYKNLLKPI